MRGSRAPGTPAKYDKVGVSRSVPAKARNVLVLEPGTSAGAAYFVPLASGSSRGCTAGRCGRWSAARTCSRTSRCSNLAKAGQATRTQVFDYYLGWLIPGAYTGRTSS